MCSQCEEIERLSKKKSAQFIALIRHLEERAQKAEYALSATEKDRDVILSHNNDMLSRICRMSLEREQETAALALTEALLKLEREKNSRAEKALGEARKLTIGGREW